VILATFAPDGPDKRSGLPVVRYSRESTARELGDDLDLVEAASHTHATPWARRSRFRICRFRRTQ